MTKHIATVDVSASALESSRIMMASGLAYVIALEKTKPIGIVTHGDLVLKVMASERNPSKVKVSEVMSSPLVTIGPDATVQEAVDIMAKRRIRRLPVIQDNILEGVFTALNFVRHFNDYEDKVLKDIFRTVSLYPPGSDV
jgi:signal-transduction protein with cAMP-binding, CBS, and nucleotidyltransferase domain